MILPDCEIRELIQSGRLTIDPFDDRMVRPGSICLRLGSHALRPLFTDTVDVGDSTTYPQYETMGEDEIVVPPRTVVLVNTLERIALPRSLAGWMSNLSGLARLGLSVVLSNYVSPGFGESAPSTLALEVSHPFNESVRLRPGMRICHLVLMRLSRDATTSYDEQVGTYSRQSDPRGSVFHRDFGPKL
ncbi:MAG: dCTP deaminase [Acidobacteriia bacterium]|nr:dCTP deaminase [Terriglobia bacterium]